MGEFQPGAQNELTRYLLNVFKIKVFDDATGEVLAFDTRNLNDNQLIVVAEPTGETRVGWQPNAAQWAVMAGQARRLRITVAGFLSTEAPVAFNTGGYSSVPFFFDVV